MISLIEITKENFCRFQGDILEIEKISFPSPWSANAFREELENPSSRFWGLKRGGSLIGYICFWMVAGEIHRLNVAVKPEERRKGYGRYLVSRMNKEGSDHQIKIAWLEVRSSNFIARILYQKMGFKEVGRRPQFYKDRNEDAIVMSISINENKAETPQAENKPNLTHVM